MLGREMPGGDTSDTSAACDRGLDSSTLLVHDASWSDRRASWSWASVALARHGRPTLIAMARTAWT